ncbi:restriction endonuclease subunit S [Mycobacterium sp. TY815]|uniref:restriction endonuclease subunit S n=1 Tax=Mycobacterium sp. TY815 TaxID=3050581 RepID=UPI002742878C|nr:restriction endonuclease subunit S [Mycobacterium sp. TY815]MDP7707360.1 restriction endonuclease subunit S [Mycobacterium sp. TY815]
MSPNLPDGWRRANIRRYATMKTGHTPSRSKPEYWENVTIPWFTLADVWQLRDGRRVYLGDTANQISELGLANSAAELLPAGTVVLSRTASVGFSGVMPRPMATSQDFWNWVCGPDLMPEYLNYQFKAIAPALRALNMGSTHQTIYQRDAAGIEIVVPPLPQQHAIVGYLDRETARIATLIEEQQRLIEMLRERRAAVIRTSVPDPRSGSIAADKLGRRTRIGNGSTPRREEQSFWERGGIPWLNSAVVNQDRVTAATQFVTVEAVAKCHLPLVPPGSVLVALTGQGKTRGTSTILDIEATINQHMAYVTPETDYWDSDYLLWCLTAEYGELRAVSDENGSTKGALTCEDLKRFPVARVALDEQRRIAAQLDDQTSRIDTLIAETARFIELARERQSALITAAVTGQIDVSESAA